MDDIRPRAADGGLRERSKARRRAAIVRAALTLFAERGYDATTIADIAAAADVAPRTVAMYFPCKQDIAMSRFSRAVDELTDALRSRRPGESVTQIVGRWLRADEPGPERELKELSLRMFAANPELNALRSARMAAATAEGAQIVAEETGAAPGSPGPRIAAAATAAILIELTDMPPGAERDEAITIAIRFLEAAVATLGPAGRSYGGQFSRTGRRLLSGPGGWHPGGDRATPVPGNQRASSIRPSPTGLISPGGPRAAGRAMIPWQQVPAGWSGARWRCAPARWAPRGRQYAVHRVDEGAARVRPGRKLRGQVLRHRP